MLESRERLHYCLPRAATRAPRFQSRRGPAPPVLLAGSFLTTLGPTHAPHPPPRARAPPFHSAEPQNSSPPPAQNLRRLPNRASRAIVPQRVPKRLGHALRITGRQPCRGRYSRRGLPHLRGRGRLDALSVGCEAAFAQVAHEKVRAEEEQHEEREAEQDEQRDRPCGEGGARGGAGLERGRAVRGRGRVRRRRGGRGRRERLWKRSF